MFTNFAPQTSHSCLKQPTNSYFFQGMDVHHYFEAKIAGNKIFHWKRLKLGRVFVATVVVEPTQLKKICASQHGNHFGRDRGTLQGTNISHLRKRKIIFKMPCLGDKLVPWRVILFSNVSKHYLKTIVCHPFECLLNSGLCLLLLVNNLTVKQSNELAALENPSELKDVLLKKTVTTCLCWVVHLALPTFTAGQTSHPYPAISPSHWDLEVPCAHMMHPLQGSSAVWKVVALGIQETLML